MKQFTLFTVLGLMLCGLLTTGFQCGSADITSAKLYMHSTPPDWEKAEASLTKEVTKNPSNAEAWYLLGHCRAQRENFSGMVEAFAACQKLSPDYDKPIGEAKKFAWGQSLNKGVTAYNKSITASKDSATALRNEAIGHYKTAIAIEPDSTVTYQNLAIAYQANENYDDEIATIQQALQHKQTMQLYTMLIDAYLIKAQNAEAAGNKQLASDNYNTVITQIMAARKFDPNDTELLGTMIDIYVKLGRAAEAKPYIQEALQKDPTNKVYQYNLGVLLMQTDSLEAAIEHFDAALSADPKYDVALQNVGVAHMKLGDALKKKSSEEGSKGTDKSFLEHFKKAAGFFERLVEIKADEPNYWDLLASAYANSNDIKKAENAIKKAEDLRKK